MYIVVISLFIVLISVIGMRTYLRWAGVHYFGGIVEIKESGFAIKTGGDGAKPAAAPRDVPR